MSNSRSYVGVVCGFVIIMTWMYLLLFVLLGQTLKHLFPFTAHRQHFPCNSSRSPTGSVHIIVLYLKCRIHVLQCGYSQPVIIASYDLRPSLLQLWTQLHLVLCTKPCYHASSFESTMSLEENHGAGVPQFATVHALINNSWPPKANKV